MNEFDSKAVFNKLDRTNNNIISIRDLKHFFKKNSIIVNDDLINLMIRSNAGLRDSLSYEE